MYAVRRNRKWILYTSPRTLFPQSLKTPKGDVWDWANRQSLLEDLFSLGKTLDKDNNIINRKK
jgi:hypothetical protein